MPAGALTCPACCKLPPVQTEYSPKGDYTELAGLKTYSAGPEDAKEAILVVYDIFGLSPQILQGASRPVLVVSPAGS